MGKKIWDIYAPVYQKAMRGDRQAYELMYQRISSSIEGLDVLEIATGPGLIAKNVASVANTIIETDYSQGIIK